MATYAIYHLLQVQVPYQSTLTNKYVTRLFVVKVPADKSSDDVKSALIRGGYELDSIEIGSGRPWLDLAWTELVISRLKEAPDEVIAAWKKGLLPKIPWEELEVDLDDADPDSLEDDLDEADPDSPSELGQPQ
jgi:hypothetical protein